MNKKHMIIIIFLVIVAILVVAVAYFVVATPTHEDPSGFGSWGQRFEVELLDGTTQPLDSVFYQENEVASIHYYLSAKSDIAGTGDISVNLDDYSLTFQIGTASYALDSTVATTVFARDGEFHEILHLSLSADDLIYELDLTTGTYTLQMLPTGSMTYDAGAGSQSSDLPSSASVEITVGTGTVDGDIGVTFDTDIVWT